jgi:ornithine carbamoyltransferase
MASKATLEPQEAVIPVQKDPDVLAAAARLAGEDMCSIADLSSGEVRAILKLGHDVKRNPRDYRHALDAKQMVLMFEKASLRTRLSFETGINTLGGNAIFVDHTSSPLGERESVSDVAKNVERWVDIIVLRTYAHDTITEMAANSRVPVVNALSDFEHPCQALADFMTLQEHFGTAKGLNFTYLGDGNNVCHSLMLTGAQLGANVTIATRPRNRRVQRLRSPLDTGSTGLSRSRRRRLHRRLRLHGHGARVHQARAHLSPLPGQRCPHAEGTVTRSLHALPARAPQRRGHRYGA